MSHATTTAPPPTATRCSLFGCPPPATRSSASAPSTAHRSASSSSRSNASRSAPTPTAQSSASARASLPTLDFPTDVDAFEFNGEVGQTVTIRVDGDIGVDVYAQLIDPVGDLIASDDDGGHGLDAEISLTLSAAGSHRVEVWGALNLEGQRQLIGSYSVLVQAGPPTEPLEGDTAADTAGVALTFLDALRQGDSATLLALAGPEALTTWGWETTADVERDLLKMQSIGLGSGALQTISRIDALSDRRSRVFIQLAEADWLRFELVSIGGLWTVDFWSHQSSAPGLTDQPADVPTDDAEAEQEESSE